MERKTCLRLYNAGVWFLSAGMLLWGGGLAQGQKSHAPRPVLEARNMPDPCRVNQVRGRRIKQSPYPYIWYYRTEVHNNSREPQRILSFACYVWTEGRWVEQANVLQHPLGTKDFVAWYNNGDPVPDGWIAPGKTAACDPNWNGFKDVPVTSRKLKWVFVAENRQGKRCTCEAPISLLSGQENTHKKP